MIEVEERSDGVAVLWLDHGRANTLDGPLLAAVAEQLDELEEGGVRAVVVTGRGRVFSAGVDLKRFLSEGDAFVEPLLAELHRSLLRLYTFPRPTVAAIGGAAIAGGCVLACACDRRLAAAGTTLGAPELRVGVPFPATALEVVVAASRGRAEELVLGGARIGAEEAREVGWVHEVVDPADLLDRAVAAAESLAAVPPDSYRLTKRLLRRPVVERIERAEAETGEEMRRIWSSDEVRRAVERYVQETLR